MSKKRKGGRASSKRQKAAERVRAERGLGSLVNRARQDDNYRNQLSSIASVIRDVSDKPQRFGKDNESRRDFILRNTDPKTGRMNSAAQAMLAFYDDGRSEYQRDLNRFITGSPVNREAYKQSGLKGAGLNLFATEFPEAFASRTGIGRIITAMDKGKDKVIEAGKKIAEVLNPEQSANLNINQQENETVIETLGKQDKDRFGSLAGDRFDTVEDIFDPEASATMASLDPEKIAIDTGLTPGTVFNPVEADLKRKINFVNQVFGTDFGGSVDMPQADTIEKLFQKAKQQQGGEIRDTIQNQQEEEEKPIAGQFQFEDFITPYQDTINLTGAVEPEQLVDEDYDFSNFQTNQALADQGVDPNLMPAAGVYKAPVQAGDQTLVFSDGTTVPQNVDTGLDVVGDNVFPSEAGSQTALDFLNSNATTGFSGYPRMGMADGGYTRMSTHEKLMRMARDMYG